MLEREAVTSMLAAWHAVQRPENRAQEHKRDPNQARDRVQSWLNRFIIRALPSFAHRDAVVLANRWWCHCVQSISPIQYTQHLTDGERGEHGFPALVSCEPEVAARELGWRTHSRNDGAEMRREHERVRRENPDLYRRPKRSLVERFDEKLAEKRSAQPRRKDETDR